PYCAAEGPLLDRLALSHPDFGWYFVYTREAHPGEHMPAHASLADKLAAARPLRDELGITRTILVDDPAGRAPTACAPLPYTSWVRARRGTILYKATWTSAARIGEFLERNTVQRHDPAQSPFHTEQLELRRRDAAVFQQGLERNGPQAVSEFARAEQIWAERARAARPRCCISRAAARAVPPRHRRRPEVAASARAPGGARRRAGRCHRASPPRPKPLARASYTARPA